MSDAGRIILTPQKQKRGLLKPLTPMKSIQSKQNSTTCLPVAMHSIKVRSTANRQLWSSPRLGIRREAPFLLYKFALRSGPMYVIRGIASLIVRSNQSKQPCRGIDTQPIFRALSRMINAEFNTPSLPPISQRRIPKLLQKRHISSIPLLHIQYPSFHNSFL